VNNGGRPAAELGPVTGRPEDSLAALIASGQVIPPERLDPPEQPRPLAVWAGMRMDSVLREVRGR
jgi:antitoxin (DNA-binding transcriptional repressor) of toxin-antitoxin stability system